MEPTVFVGARGDKLTIVGPLEMTHDQAIELAAKLIVMAGDWPDLQKCQAACTHFANT